MPNVMGILTHLDYFRENKHLRKTKKKMKKRFWKEVYDGAKHFESDWGLRMPQALGWVESSLSRD